jgi:hypothetical protein
MANLGWPSYRKMPQWPVPLEAARLHALLVLVDEPEQVDIQVLARPRRRAAVRRQALQQPVVEPLRVGRLGASVTVGGPADLPDDDGHVAVTYRHERRHQRVKVGLEHVGVRDAVVVHTLVLGWGVVHIGLDPVANPGVVERVLDVLQSR